MSTTPSGIHGEAAERLIADYLERLERAAAGLPDDTRAELLADIRGHLSDTAGPSPDEATVRQILDDLGEPGEIVAAAAPESGMRPARTGGELAYDVCTVLILILGGFVVPFVGWIAGVAMLWGGPRWQPRHKWIGTLLWPAAIIVGMAGLLVAHDGGPAVVSLFIAGAVVIVGLLAGFAYLLRAAQPAR